MEINDKVRFEVDYETQIKRKITFSILICFLLSSTLFLFLGINDNVFIATTTALLVGLIIQICNWIEGSKLISISKRDYWIVNNLEMLLLVLVLALIFSMMLALVIFFLIQMI